jgi:hypothetical protein
LGDVEKCGRGASLLGDLVVSFVNNQIIARTLQSDESRSGPAKFIAQYALQKVHHQASMGIRTRSLKRN